MLYDLNWLAPGKSYPPKSELERINRCRENEHLFGNDHYSESVGPWHNFLYGRCIDRLSEAIGCDDGTHPVAKCFPVILNYQRAMSLKTADLVCGEYPSITGKSSQDTEDIQELCESTDLFSKLYATVIDLSRYGDAVWRIFKDEDTRKGNFTIWSPQDWFPIVRNDGTNREYAQALCWKMNVGTADKPRYELHAQIHYVGYYMQQIFEMDGSGATIVRRKTNDRVPTGLSINAVMHMRNIHTSNTVYGYDDYMPIDSLLSEILTRIGQISKILDKHASPSMTGPATMLTRDEKTGKYYLKMGEYFATSSGDNEPKYLTWDGQLDAAFKELEILLQQLYMLSELGEALMGSMGASNGQAISGTAMRFKLANPLIKARRISNAMALPVRKLIAGISTMGYASKDLKDISIEWEDGLPDDPRENIDLALAASGAPHLMPLEITIQEYFDKTPEEAAAWVRQLKVDYPEAAKETSSEGAAATDGSGEPGGATVVGSGKSRDDEGAPMRP